MLLKTSLTVVVCLLAGAAAAQERLSLADATDRALARNRDIRVERENVAAANARWIGAGGAYDIVLNVDLTGRHHRDPIQSMLSSPLGSRDDDSRTSLGSTLTFTQLFRTGAKASASTTLARNGGDSGFSFLAPAYSSSLGVELQQPLLRNRAVDPARTSLLVTALDRDRSGAALARQVQQTVAEVETAYWTLVAARSELDVRRSSVALAEQQRRETQARIEAGAMAASDLAQPTAEVERRRGDVFIAQEAVARAERALKLLMLDDADDPAWAVAIEPSEMPAAAPSIVDVAASLDQARRARPELEEQRLRVSQREAQVTLVRDSLKPRLDLVAGYTMRGLGGDLERYSFPLDHRSFADALVGVSFELPLGHREARGQVGAAEAERRRAAMTLAQTHDRIAMEVLNAATSLETSAGRIQAARAALAAAQTQLRAEQDRFAAGLTTTFFVLTRQNELAVAQLAEIAALTDYRKGETELARARGSLLRDRGINVERNWNAERN
jgi:HAE1 family hydrophobic/amphiphilic exporter-1